MGTPFQDCWHCWLEGSHLGKALMPILHAHPAPHFVPLWKEFNEGKLLVQFQLDLSMLAIQDSRGFSIRVLSTSSHMQSRRIVRACRSLWALLTQLTRRYLTCDPRFCFSNPSTKVIFDLYSLSSFLMNCRKRKKTHQEMLKLFFLPTRRLLE